MAKLKFEAEFQNQTSTVKTKLDLVSFMDENIHYVYCPALDLTGYGYTEKEAKDSFSQTLKMYLEYTLNKKTLLKDLQDHGWNVKNRKKLKAPSFSDLVSTNSELRNIVSKDFNKYSTEIDLTNCVDA